MKTTFSTLVLVSITFLCSAQLYVQKVNVNEQSCNFISINTNVLNQRSCPLIDYGQGARRWKDMRATDAAGNKMKFNSMTAVIDFLDRNGWDLVEMNTEQNQSMSVNTVTHEVTNKEGEKKTPVHTRLSPSSGGWYYFLFKRKPTAAASLHQG